MFGPKETRLSLAWQDICDVPATLAGRGAEVITELDLSNNQFKNLSSLEPFRRLRSLILDHNELDSTVRFPPLPSLETLWVNHNKIPNLVTFIDHVAFMFPKLGHLSMLNNPACPNYFNGGTPEQYHDYRLYVISRLTHLKMLDDLRVRDEERDESLRQYGAYRPTVAKSFAEDGPVKPKVIVNVRRKHEGTVRRENVPLPEGPPFLPSPKTIEQKQKAKKGQAPASPQAPPVGLPLEQDDDWSDEDVDLADPGIRAYMETHK